MGGERKAVVIAGIALAILLAGTLLSVLKHEPPPRPEGPQGLDEPQEESVSLDKPSPSNGSTDLDEPHPLGEGTLLDDRFDTGLDNWSYWGDSGYVLQWASGAAKLSGDGYMVEGGMQKVVDLSTWNESGGLWLSFDWRATSGTADSCVTQATLWIQDADSGSSLQFLRLVYGGTMDTGWLHYVEDIYSYAQGHSRIRIILYVGDGWSADWQEMNFYDNMRLEFPRNIGCGCVPLFSLSEYV